MHKLQMTKRLSDAIKTHIEASAPYVAGGFLFGHGEDILDFAPALNIVEGLPENFEFDEEDFERASEVANKRDMDPIGLYSSCSSKIYELNDLFVNNLPVNSFLLVGITQNAELIDLELYYHTEQGVESSEISIVEVQEADY